MTTSTPTAASTPTATSTAATATAVTDTTTAAGSSTGRGRGPVGRAAAVLVTTMAIIFGLLSLIVAPAAGAAGTPLAIGTLGTNPDHAAQESAGGEEHVGKLESISMPSPEAEEEQLPPIGEWIQPTLQSESAAVAREGANGNGNGHSAKPQAVASRLADAVPGLAGEPEISSSANVNDTRHGADLFHRPVQKRKLLVRFRIPGGR